MAQKNFITNEIGTLNSGVESLFHKMIEHDKEFEDAIDFVDNCVNMVPHYTLIRTVLFKILMDRECTHEAAISAGLYLQKILKIHPPSDFGRRSYYKGALTYGNNIFENIWEAFCRFVESTLCHHNIYSVPQEELDKIGKYEVGLVQAPNCDILVSYFIKVFVESYEYLSAERSFYENKEKSLVAELFWPSSEAVKYSIADTNPLKFLTWINSIHQHQIECVPIFRDLHSLLNLMIRCVIDSEYMRVHTARIETSDALICNSNFLIDIVKVLMKVCKETFASDRCFRRIMNYLTLKSLKIKLCEYRLHDLIYSKFPPDKSSPTTLKDIVSKYVFYNKTRKGRPKKNKQPEPKEKENHKNMKDKTTKDKPKQKSKQHLKDKQNVKKELTKIGIKLAYKDGAAGDKEEMKFPGSNLMNAVDKFGRKPYHYAGSKEMEEILKDYIPPDFNSNVEETSATVEETSATVEETSAAVEETSAAVGEASAAPEPEPFNLNQPIPPMNNFKDSALHFHALQYLLCYYSDVHHIFDAIEMINKGQLDKIRVYKHEDKACLHYKSYEEMTLCSEDLEIAKHQPTIIKNFLISAVKSAEEKNLSLDLELLPLKMYLAALSS